jgi:MFS family permease
MAGNISQVALLPTGNRSSVFTLIAAYLGLFVGLIDSNAVNLALPAIRADLGGGVSGAQWTADAYNVTFAAVLLTVGSLGDRFGRRFVLRSGLVTFVAASLACALAPSLSALLAARAAHGVGAALMLPQGLAIAAATFPDAAGRARATAAWAMAVLTLGSLTVVLVEGRTLGAALATALAAATVIGGAGFVWSQRRLAHPMVPPQFFGNRRLAFALVATFAMTFGTYGMLLVNSLAFQQSRGVSALATAVAFLPMPLVYLTLIPAVNVVAPRTGPRLPSCGCWRRRWC